MTSHARRKKRRDGASTKRKQEPIGYEKTKYSPENITDGTRQRRKNGQSPDAKMDGAGERKGIQRMARPMKNNNAIGRYKVKISY